MVSKVPRQGGSRESLSGARKENGTPGPSREGQVGLAGGNPRFSRNESSTPKPSQDAELKDYVWHSIPFTNFTRGVPSNYL